MLSHRLETAQLLKMECKMGGDGKYGGGGGDNEEEGGSGCAAAAVAAGKL